MGLIMTEIIPTLLIERWQEALKNPSMQQWRAVKELCLREWLRVDNLVPLSVSESGFINEQLMDIATLEGIAYQHQIDLQPTRVEYI